MSAKEKKLSARLKFLLAVSNIPGLDAKEVLSGFISFEFEQIEFRWGQFSPAFRLYKN